MERGSKGGWMVDWIWLLAWGVASSAWCINAADRLGATFDEPVYMARGLDYWRTGSHAGLMKLGTMPLPVDITTLPLYLWERHEGIPLDPQADLPRVLPWARMGTLLFWWLLLIYGWRSGRQLAGAWGGRVAVALLACEPSLLAHASLATTDIAVSACLLALVYHFRTGRERPDSRWLWRVVVPAFWFGAAVLTKASGLVFGSLCMAAVEVERLWYAGMLVPDAWRRNPAEWHRSMGDGLRVLWGQWASFRRDALQIAGLGFVLVFWYCGSDWRAQPSFVAWAHHLPAGPSATVLVWIADHLRIFSNAGEGIVRQITHNCRGHGVYLLGQTAPRALWYYFPVALTIKLSLPLLALPVLLAVIRPRTLVNWALVCAVLLLAFSVTCRVQIGIRLVLPLVVLLVVGLAAAVVNAWRQSPTNGRRSLLRVAAAVSIAWTAAAAIAVWPEGLCYTNELWGGTSRGYLYLSDSNYDWGQGLKELVNWEQRQGVASMDVWYGGTDPALRSLPLADVRFQDMPLTGPADVVACVRGHYLAASTTYLYGAYANTPGHRIAAAFLRACRPVARTQTYLIYDFTHAHAIEDVLPPQ